MKLSYYRNGTKIRRGQVITLIQECEGADYGTACDVLSYHESRAKVYLKTNRGRYPIYNSPTFRLEIAKSK